MKFILNISEPASILKNLFTTLHVIIILISTVIQKLFFSRIPSNF